MKKQCPSWNEWRELPGNADKPAGAWREEMVAAGLMRPKESYTKEEIIKELDRRAKLCSEAYHKNSSKRR